MPDTQVTEPEVKTETPVETPEPHPLSPGGQRFEQVIAERNQLREEIQSLRDRQANLEGRVQQQQQPPPQQAPQFYSPEQLQTAVDRGLITPAQMAQQIAWQQTQIASRDLIARQQYETRSKAALDEVNAYVEKMPSLMSTSSEDFRRVQRTAQDVSDDMGLPVSDPRVQRRALRETFGTLDRIAARQKLQQDDREARRPHAESGDGGTPAEVPTKANDVSAALKGIPQAQIDWWKSKNYSPARMAEEAKYYRRRG